MAGLNYGYSYTKKRGMHKNKKVGVSYAELAHKWVVRVLKNGTVTTVAGFKTKEEADKYYKELK